MRPTSGNFLNCFRYIISCFGVNSVYGSKFFRQFKFFIVNVNSHYICTSRSSNHYGREAHSTATMHRHPLAG